MAGRPRTYGGRWRVVGSLSEGGQAHTFLVEDESKVLPGRFVLKRLRDRARLERLKREVSILEKLDHRNVLKIVDHSLDSDPAYIVTEYCEGGDLDHNREPWLSEALAALELFQDVCEGVAAAHEAGIVHRDIKPANVFLRGIDGPAVVGDFGIAYVEDDTRQTEAGEVMGPRWFTAPELEDGRLDQVSPASDVYSLGKFLYWLLSGGRRLAREDFNQDETNLVYLKREPLMEHVNRLLDLMIEQDPTRRLKSAAEVLHKLRTVKRLIEHRYNPPSNQTSRVVQVCTYCGQGMYKLVHSGAPAGYSKGLTFPGLSGVRDWRVLVCEVCGHVQFFSVDHAAHKDWWNEDEWQRRDPTRRQ